MKTKFNKTKGFFGEKKTLINYVLTSFQFILFIAIIFSIFKIYSWKKDIDKNNMIKSEVLEIINWNEDYENKDFLNVNFEDLKEKNIDTKAYLILNGTEIEYPIVKGEDNLFYLKHSFDKSENIAGWPFFDYRNKLDGTDKNIIVYGHNMYDGKSMFSTQEKTLTKKWLDDPENHYLKILTPYGYYEYEVFSVYSSDDELEYLKTIFLDDKEFKDFLQKTEERSIHNFEKELSLSDKIITLSTCELNRLDRRIVLHAKMINE